MNVLTTLPLKRGVLKYNYERIRKGESITYDIYFATPLITEITKLRNSRQRNRIWAPRIYSTPAKFLKTILIAPEPEQVPTLREKNVNAKIYLEEYAMVSLFVKNNANYELKNVRHTDTLPEGLNCWGQHSLQWVVHCSSKRGMGFTLYDKTPESEQGRSGFAAQLQISRREGNNYSIMSNQPPWLSMALI